MDEQLFKDRTKRLGLEFISLVEELPKTRTADIIGRQLIRSALRSVLTIAPLAAEDLQRTLSPNFGLSKKKPTNPSIGRNFSFRRI
jgi:hypothetical protein